MVFAYVTTDWFIFILVLWFCHKQRKQIVSFKARLIERTYCHLPEKKTKKSPIEIEKLKKNWIKMILNPKRK